MRWYAGTSGFSYPEWKGSFYPPDLPAGEMLGFYASKLPAVEINNTFYRMPRLAMLEDWAAAVPEAFRFVIKAPRRITHQMRLKDAAEPTAYLADKLAALGPRLAAVLFQLPPNLRCDGERLQAFLDELPAGLPAVFEFRHPSWHCDATWAQLEAAGAALCLSEDGSLALPERTVTSDWAYLRLRKPDYSDQALIDWMQRVERSGATSALVFFKHEDEGAGPALAQRFLELAAARAAAPPRRGPRAVRRGAGRRGSGSAATADEA